MNRENEIFDPEALKVAEEHAPSNDKAFGEYNGIMLRKPMEKIGKEHIAKAMGILQKYKDGKAELEARIVDEENFYMLQYYKRVKQRQNKNADGETPASAWLFNSLHNKHADYMDSYPEPICLPREKSDEEEAKKLSAILPVILEQNGFEKTYSDAGWYKLKHGVAAYSVLWNPELENGLGNIDIGRPDILNLFWAPGVKDIQDSPNFFSIEMVDNELLESEYPALEGKLGNPTFDIKQYNHNNTDMSEKTMVVDWYYKRKVGGRKVLHYCKFVEGNVLYASENDPEYAQRGYYDHGKYPFVFDVLFPEEGTPTGFGIIAIARDPQVYIDLLDKAILDHALKSSKPRWFAKKSSGVNNDEYLDWNNPIVTVEGDINEEKLRSIEIPNLSSVVMNERDSKINELKETSSNRDFSNGSTASGVTSGAAIAVLQESGNKTTRDMLKGSYRAFVAVNRLKIELIRQFYTDERAFRIKNPNGGAGYEFTTYNNAGLQPQPVTMSMDGREVPVTNAFGEAAVRVPILDIDVRAQKQSPFTTIAQNETAMNLYSAGFFNPELAQQSLICLEMMDFEGKEKVYDYVVKGQTLFNQVQQLNAQVGQASQMLAAAGINPGMFGLMPMGVPTPQPMGSPMTSDNPISTAQDNAQAAQSSYTQKLMEKAKV